MVTASEHKAKIVKVVANDARICLENLAILEEIEAGRAASGAEGRHHHSHIFERLAQNAQQAAMINLAKVFDDAKGSLGLKELEKKLGSLPDELSMPQPIKPHQKSLKEWRNGLLAHSGKQQLQSNISTDFPLTQNDLASMLDYALTVIEHYRNAECPDVQLSIPPDLSNVIDPRWKAMKDAVEVILGSKVAVARDDPRIQGNSRLGV